VDDAELEEMMDAHPEIYGHPFSYYRERFIVLDIRGTMRISPKSHLSYRVCTYTLSHSPNDFSKLVDRPVIIDDDAWIGSNCILYNCHIGEGAIVSCGSVVLSRDVPPWTMVEGNPIQIIARFNHETKRWEYLDEPQPVLRRTDWNNA
jgi:acetyltransferase-like isoleucine patch superfamily enzyme